MIHEMLQYMVQEYLFRRIVRGDVQSDADFMCEALPGALKEFILISKGLFIKSTCMIYGMLQRHWRQQGGAEQYGSLAPRPGAGRQLRQRGGSEQYGSPAPQPGAGRRLRKHWCVFPGQTWRFLRRRRRLAVQGGGGPSPACRC